MKLKCYKSPIGVLIQAEYSSFLMNHLVNDKQVEKTFTSNWMILRNELEIKSVKKKVTTYPKVISYILKQEDLVSDKIPATLSLEEVGHYRDEDGDTCWRNHSTLRSLYREIRSETEESYEEEEFEVEYLGQLDIENVDDPVTTKIKLAAYNSSYGGKEVVEKSIASLAEYGELVKAIVPDLVIHNQPCLLPSPVAYQIIRAHVKENIDPKNAYIGSDYDFCFTVKKKLHIKPINSKKEVLTARGKSYRPPRFSTTTKSYKELEVFEMTQSKDRYGSYTVIEAFKGNNLKELADNVEAYLEELMVYINTPLSECEHCNGTGHIVGEKFQVNKRT